MSDFLSNLADRSLGAAAVIQPRLLSLFEPPPRENLPASLSIDWRHGDPVSETDSETATEARPPRFRPPEARPVPAPLDNAQARGPREENAAFERRADLPKATEPSSSERSPAASTIQPRPDHSVAPAPRVTNVSPVVFPEEESPARSPHRHTDESTGEGEASPKPPTIGRVALPATILGLLSDNQAPKDAPQESRSPSHAEKGTALRPIVPEQQIHVKTAPGALIAPAIPPPRRTELLATPVIESRVTRQMAAAQTASRQTSASAETVVQVTIGRIDVRALPQQPSPSKTRAASKVMSLNDYLERRSKRGNA
jgi:hypothetical protein